MSALNGIVMEITAELLRQVIEDKGIKQKRLADFISLKPDQMSKVMNGTRQLTAHETDKVREFLADIGYYPSKLAATSPHDKVNREDGTNVLTVSPPARNMPDIGLGLPNAVFVSPPASSNRKLPVLGTAVGGKEGSFVMNGEAVDYRPAPAALEAVAGAFYVRATGESMYPRFFEGELLAIDPHRPLRKGDCVLVEMHGFDGVPGDAFVKMFKGYAGNAAVLEQFNPPKNIKIDRDKIRRIMHIYIEGVS